LKLTIFIKGFSKQKNPQILFAQGIKDSFSFIFPFLLKTPEP